MLTQLTPEAFESSSGYPRTYRVSLGWKLFLVGFGILFGLGGIAGVILLPSPHGRFGTATLLADAVCAGFAGLGVYFLLYAWKYRVVLTADGVELVGPFRSRRLSCEEIEGRRTVRNQNGPRTLVLVPRDTGVKKLKISLVLKTDAMFDAWIARLPDLDQQELHRSEQELAETLYQNLPPHQRAARIKRLKLIARWINWTATGLAVGMFVLPDYHHVLIAILIAAPWIAIGLVARFQPLYRFGGKRNDSHPDLTVALMIPGLLLMVRALADAHTFDWPGPLMLAVAGGLPVGVAALRVDPWFRRQRLVAALTCIFTLAYGFGAGLEIDVLADSTQPTIYPTQVLGKRFNRGSRSTTYYLKVGPWGPIARDHEMSVSAGRYRATNVGDTICIYVGKGALRVPWYQPRDCR